MLHRPPDVENVAETPGGCVANFAVNLSHEITPTHSPHPPPVHQTSCAVLCDAMPWLWGAQPVRMPSPGTAREGDSPPNAAGCGDGLGRRTPV